MIHHQYVKQVQLSADVALTSFGLIYLLIPSLPSSSPSSVFCQYLLIILFYHAHYNYYTYILPTDGLRVIAETVSEAGPSPTELKGTTRKL